MACYKTKHSHNRECFVFLGYCKTDYYSAGASGVAGVSGVTGAVGSVTSPDGFCVSSFIIFMITDVNKLKI